MREVSVFCSSNGALVRSCVHLCMHFIPIPQHLCTQPHHLSFTSTYTDRWSDHIPGNWQINGRQSFYFHELFGVNIKLGTWGNLILAGGNYANGARFDEVTCSRCTTLLGKRLGAYNEDVGLPSNVDRSKLGKFLVPKMNVIKQVNLAPAGDKSKALRCRECNTCIGSKADAIPGQWIQVLLLCEVRVRDIVIVYKYVTCPVQQLSFV